MPKKGLKLPAIAEDGEVSPKAAQEFEERKKKCLATLNYNIGKILEEFESEALPLLRDLGGARPSTIQEQLKSQKVKIVQMVNELAKYVDPLSSNGYRIVFVEAAKKLMDAYSRFILETNTEAEEVAGQKTN